MKKRLIAGLVTFVCICTLFAGCSQKNNESDEGFAVITWESQSTNQKAVMTEIIENFNNTTGKEKKIKIDYKVTNSADATAGEVAFQTRQEPDLGGSIGLAQGVEKDYLLDISKIPGAEELLKKYEGSLVEGWHTYNGGVYAVPYGSVTAGLFYNKDLFKKAGLVDENGEAKAPSTYEEVIECAKKLTNKKDRQFGILFDMKWSGFSTYVTHYLSQTNGGHRGYDFDNDIWDCSVYKPVLEMFLKLRDEGCVYPGAEGIERDAARAYFAAGNIGMFFGLSSDVGEFEYNFPPNFDLGVVPLPTEKADVKYYQPAHPQWTPYISKRILEHASEEQVYEIIKLLTSDEMAIALYKGGAAIPWNYDLIKDVEFDSDIACWQEMGEMLAISRPYRDPAPSDLAGKDVNYMPRIWNNGEDIDTVLNEITEIRNEGQKRYREKHPEYDVNQYRVRNYNERR